MDTDGKVILTLAVMGLLCILTAIIAINMRWRSNQADYYELQRTMTNNGYIQKQVPSGMTTIWVKDPNAK